MTPWNELRLRLRADGLEVALHIQPRARRSEVAGLFNGALKLKITAPPADGAANRAIVEFVAARLHIPRSRIRIVSGAKSREKVVRIEGITAEEFLASLPSL